MAFMKILCWAFIFILRLGTNVNQILNVHRRVVHRNDFRNVVIISDIEEEYLRTFIIIIKTNGANLVPCGIPALVIGRYWEKIEPSLTACPPPGWKFPIEWMIGLLTLISISFSRTMLWFILSKALLASRKHALRYWPGWSRANS